MRLTKKQKQLIIRLNELCEKLDTQYSINFGGCCFVCYCIAKLFEQYNIYYKLTVFGENLNLNLLEDDDSFNHYAIRVGNTLINPAFHDFQDNHITIMCTSNQILNHYNNVKKVDGWNPCYLKKNNKLIQRHIFALSDL